MSYISNAIGIAGLAYNMFKSKEAAKTTEEAAAANAANLVQTGRHNATVSRYDASVARLDALFTETSTGLAVHDFLKQAGKLMTSQRTGYAKSGVALTGSAKVVMSETRKDVARAAEIIRFNGLTAAAAKESLAKRYDLLAEYGLRDSAAQAYQIEVAGSASADVIRSKAISSSLSGLYDISTEAGWF